MAGFHCDASIDWYTNEASVKIRFQTAVSVKKQSRFPELTFVNVFVKIRFRAIITDKIKCINIIYEVSVVLFTTQR